MSVADLNNIYFIKWVAYILVLYITVFKTIDYVRDADSIFDFIAYFIFNLLLNSLIAYIAYYLFLEVIL